MDKQFLKDGLGWGFGLWLIGYILGIVFFMFIPPQLLGWVITPIGTAMTLWVLLVKINSKTLDYYFRVGAVWALIAVTFDYLFIVRLFKPENGYYRPDVFLYYALALTLPVLVGWYKTRSKRSA